MFLNFNSWNILYMNSVRNCSFFFLKGNKGLEVTAALYKRHCRVAEPEGEEKGCVLPRRLLSETG